MRARTVELVDGRFRLRSVPCLARAVVVQVAGCCDLRLSLAEHMRSDHEIDLGILSPTKARALRGQVLEAGGPSPHAWVSLRGPGPVQAWVRADHQGRFELRSADAGRDELLACSATGDGATTTSVDGRGYVLVSLTDTASIRGRLQSAAPARCLIELSGARSRQAWTSEDGSFRFRRLPAGQYRLQVTSDVHTVPVAHVELAAGRQVCVDLQEDPAAMTPVEVRVLRAGSPLRLGQLAVADADNDSVPRVVTVRDGVAVVLGLSGQRWRFVVLDSTGNKPLCPPRTVRVGPTQRRQGVVLHLSTHRLKGRIQAPPGTASAAMVMAIASRGDAEPGMAVVGEDQKFEIVGLEPGDYRVVGLAPGLRPRVGMSPVVRVGRNQPVAVTLRLRPSVGLQLRVRDASGRQVADCGVALQTKEGAPLRHTASRTDSKGVAQLHGVPAGQYRVIDLETGRRSELMRFGEGERTAAVVLR